MDREGGAALNLAVVDVDDDGFTVSEAAHVEGMVRTFLATEYGAVRDVLQAHRTLLDAMTDALLRDGLLDQGAMAELVRQHAPTTTNLAGSP